MHAVDDGPTDKIKRIALKEHWENVPSGGTGRCKAHEENAWPLFNSQKRANPAQRKPRNPSEPLVAPPKIKKGTLGTYTIGGDCYGFVVGQVNEQGKELILLKHPDKIDLPRHFQTITWRRTNEWVKKADGVKTKRSSGYFYYFGSALNRILLDPSF
jgi:hypothetical protein